MNNTQINKYWNTLILDATYPVQVVAEETSDRLVQMTMLLGPAGNLLCTGLEAAGIAWMTLCTGAPHEVLTEGDSVRVYF